jgi:alpha-ribazole phosphatase
MRGIMSTLEDLTPEMQTMQQANRAVLPPTRLYLMRHGEPDHDNLNRYYGEQDVPLGERGRRQSHALAERLRDVPLDAVYSSDLARAIYLAELLAEPRGLPVRCLAALRERRMGALQGCTAEEMERDHAEEYGRWRADRVNHRVPEGENFIDVAGRVVPVIEELAAAFRGRRVAVTTHAGPIRVAVAHALGLPLDNIFRITVNYCGLFVLEFPHDEPPCVTLMNG